MKFEYYEGAMFKDAIDWFLERENLQHVKIKLRPTNTPFHWGWCDNSFKDQFKAEIFITKTGGNVYSRLCVLFHELTHAKQFAEGRLVRTKDAMFWMGDDMTDTGYEECPWEIEATAVEGILADLYLAERD